MRRLARNRSTYHSLQFIERLKPYRGEIKGMLIRGEFIAGIGNAYADEILWAARLIPIANARR